MDRPGPGDVRGRRRDGDAESAPTLHGGKVYLTTGVGRIYALDAATGRIAWQSIDREETHGDTVRRYGRAGGPVSVFALTGGTGGTGGAGR
ncbi:PQQ-binding-like beta-propeller repeat protein [Streptomyces sp. NPDC007861]|uniref:outer membrane protein assembly factor BamB family protein n=1 Tax=Streptomyces sp. NPDC007861 TaxID=3154893 RepID=UPI00340EE509